MPKRWLAVSAAAIVIAYYLFFTWKSVGLYFDQDDMMNLYLAWTKPMGGLLRANLLYWTDPLRPLGALFYRIIFELAGFDPMPFRIVCLALGLVNLGLCCWFVKLVSGSGRVIALTALLFAFHTRLMEVWFRTAVIYDLICFTFFYAGLCLYLAVRTRDKRPGVLRSLLIAACFIAAMDAKEVAIALPAVMLAWELVFPKFNWRNLIWPAGLGLLALPYLWAKTLGPGAITNNPYYLPEYSLSRFAETWGTFLGFLFVQPDPLKGWLVFALLLIPLAIALILRSRELIFCWGLLMLATLPMSFLPYRGGFVLYISFVGWSMFAALMLKQLTDIVPGPKRTNAAIAVFLLVGWRVGKIHLHDQRLGPRDWLYDSPRMVKTLADQIATIQPSIRRSTHMLFVNDPFATDEHTPVFILRLLYEDKTLVADRVKMMNPKPATWDGYDLVFTYEDGNYRRLKP